MAEVLVFHHAQGRTPGVEAFAQKLRAAGHIVHVPDLYGGRTFDDLEDGVGYADEVGFATIVQRGAEAADGLSDRLVAIGFSLGVLPAQDLAQNRPGAAGAVLVSGCVPPGQFGSSWPEGVPLQVHGMEADPFFAGEGDLEAARELVAEHDDRELFLYRGQQHLFTDATLPSYDRGATDLVVKRTIDLLDGLDVI